MKNLFASALTMMALFIGTQSFAQTTKGSTTTTTTTTTATSTLSPKAKMLCKTWQIKSIEAWAVAHDATDAEKKDLFYLGEDGNCRFIWGGTTYAGKWTIDKSNTWMKITTNDGQTVNIKVTSVSDSELHTDYKDKDDQHNLVTYIVNPASSSGQR